MSVDTIIIKEYSDTSRVEIALDNVLSDIIPLLHVHAFYS